MRSQPKKGVNPVGCLVFRLRRAARSKAVAGAALRPLFPWEVEWFDALLPPPPARILVAGAGAGAEVVALRARGYAVAATEPVERLARQCAEVGARPVWPLDHEALGTLAGERFDAVLLGWGSLTHVLTPAGRQRTLEAAAALTSGPILASFWTQASAGPPPSGRLVAWAERAGTAVATCAGPPTSLRAAVLCVVWLWLHPRAPRARRPGPGAGPPARVVGCALPPRGLARPRLAALAPGGALRLRLPRRPAPESPRARPEALFSHR
jgi:hypothetical protein